MPEIKKAGNVSAADDASIFSMPLSIGDGGILPEAKPSLKIILSNNILIQSPPDAILD